LLLLLTTIPFLRSLPRLTATFGARTLLRLIAVAILGALLPFLTPASTGGPLAIVGVAIAILCALPLIGIAVTVLRTLTLVGVPIALLGTLPLIGIAVAVFGALPLIGIAAAVLRALPIVPIAILGALTVVTVTAIGRALLRSCSTRRVVT
jgi:hypothetical protein